jgi:hypothetical protein
MEGEDGVRWRISQLEAELDTLRDRTGEIPTEKIGVARSIQTRLKGLYDLVGTQTDSPSMAPSCIDTPDVNSGTGSCGNQNFSYNAYACGKYAEYGVSTPYGHANASLTNCSGGWSGKAEAFTYRDSGVEESDYDSSGWGQSPQASSSLTLRSSATCGYAWSRVTVCYNCEEGKASGGGESTYFVYEAENDYPNGCY